MNWILKYSPIFFDFDGLLVDTEHLHFKAYQRLLANHGISFPWDFSTYLTVAHKSSSGLRKMITAHAPTLLASHPWDTLYEEKKAAYVQLIGEGGLTLMPGAAEVLKRVHAEGIPHGVVTNSTRKQISIIREQLPILATIPHWITREDYERAKPAPDAYLKAIEIIGSSDIMVGLEDSLKGINALQGASITPILISSMPKKKGSPFQHYSSFNDII